MVNVTVLSGQVSLQIDFLVGFCFGQSLSFQKAVVLTTQHSTSINFSPYIGRIIQWAQILFQLLLSKSTLPTEEAKEKHLREAPSHCGVHQSMLSREHRLSSQPVCGGLLFPPGASFLFMTSDPGHTQSNRYSILPCGKGRALHLLGSRRDGALNGFVADWLLMAKMLANQCYVKLLNY